MNGDTDRQIREVASILEAVAGQFPSGSPEHSALRVCMFAYGFCIMRYREEFEAFCRESTREPTPEELFQLRQYEQDDK